MLWGLEEANVSLIPSSTTLLQIVMRTEDRRPGLIGHCGMLDV